MIRPTHFTFPALVAATILAASAPLVTAQTAHPSPDLDVEPQKLFGSGAAPA